MKIRLIPIETVVINTGKSNADIYTSLIKTLSHRIGSTTKLLFPEASDSFSIERKLGGRSRIVIIANCIISNKEGRKTIFIDVTAKEDKWFLPGIIIWYSVSFLFFLLLVFGLIRDHEFRFFVFLPLVFILLGYSLTTLSMQGAIDQLIAEIRKAVK